MASYPLKEINRDLWEKKVNSTSMFTIPAEDEALPNLHEFDEMLTRLNTMPLAQTLDEPVVQYFFTYVFPTICSKIIRSRYFKNQQVLRTSNSILQKSVYLIPTYFDYAIKKPKFLDILLNVFTDEYYFKTNNQLIYSVYPYSFLSQPTKEYKVQKFQVGDYVDVLKTSSLYQKFTWSQGIISEVYENQVQISYLYDKSDKVIKLKKDSVQIAPFRSKSYIFDWRMGLKKGDLVDVEDSFGTWYNGTVIDVIQKQQGKKSIKVTLKVYHEDGNRHDQYGKYFGFAEYQETLDFTNSKLAPFCSVAKQFGYESSKVSSYDSVEDLNDYEFLEWNGERIYAFPRKKNLSQLQFQTVNGFGQLKGFDKFIEYLQKEADFDVFCCFVKAISGVSAYLHRKLVRDLVQKLKDLFEKYLFDNVEKTSKKFTKEFSEMVFSGLKILQKRIYSSEKVTKYQNSLKMKLVDIWLQSQAIKNKLQGLNQLKDIVRNVIHSSDKYNYIRQWVINNQIFQKVYLTNSHVQLIKKSEEFFKYLINQNILEVTELQKLYRMAQKSDFESRVTLYKLFQQVSHIFKRDHVLFLIDTILESELNLVLNEDIDLLHQLSRFSNYFPLEKVVNFFQNVILGDNKIKQLNDYAIKKYSEMVSKGLELKAHQRKIIKNFIDKLETHDVYKVTRTLKGILQGIGGIGEWSKRQLHQIVSEQKIDEKLVEVLRKSKAKNSAQFNKISTVVLDLLLFMYKLTSKIKIYSKLVIEIWNMIEGNEQKEKEFYKWANQIFKCEQGLETTDFLELEQFCKRLFPSQKLPDLSASQFELVKSIFLEINKKARNLSITTSMKQKDIYIRKVQLNSLKLIDLISDMIYNIKSQHLSHTIIEFFTQLYTSKDNSQTQTTTTLSRLISDFQEQNKNKEYSKLGKTIKLILIIINDSQKNIQCEIKSLISKKYPQYIKYMIINQTSYISDTVKKLDMLLADNMTVMGLRRLLAKEFGLTWKQVKITSDRQIEQYQNSKTLKQLKLPPSQPLTITKKLYISTHQQQLILNNKMNPKATRCWKIIFDKFSTNGKMSKQQCINFISACLGSTINTNSKYYNQRTNYLFNQYDQDKDDFISFENFHLFYQDSAKEKASTVWSNLRSFGVKGDLTFNYQISQNTQITHFPRKTIAQLPNIYETLFTLLHVKDVASVAFELLLHLPVSMQIETQLLSITSKQSLYNLFQTKDLYQIYYKLNIVQYLALSTQLTSQEQKNWHKLFIQYQGYELLYNCLQGIKNEENKIKEGQGSESVNVVRQVEETCFNLLNPYWIQCFCKDSVKVRTSQALICSQQQMQQKMDYLIFGRFFKSNKKIQPIPLKLPPQISTYTWQSTQKPKILQFLLAQLQQKWLQMYQIEHSSKSAQRKYNLFSILSKIMDSINIMYMDENPSQLLHLISKLFDNVPNQQLIHKLYCIILSQCFYALEEHYQSLYIRELFKNLTKSSITSVHFRVLALLVSRFGIFGFRDDRLMGEEAEESNDKFKEVLLGHVLDNNNELTIEGCAKLLTNFNLQGISFDTFERIWSQRIFNSSTICQKDQTKTALFDLILKICENNIQLTDKIIEKIISSLESQIQNMKITYCNQFKQRSQAGYAGLKNLGNTCYINSMMQQMFMNKNFRYSLLRADDQKNPNLIEVIDNKNQVRIVDDNFLHQCQRIFAYLQQTNRIDFIPKDFCVAYKPFGESVNIMMQQDVQEFISMFFDRLEAGLSKTVFKRLVDDFYTGKTVNLFKCHSCSQTKKVQQSFYSISLEVKTSKTLSQSFNRFCHGQMISDFKCEFCNNKVDVTKKTRISRAPKTLIIHLQRIVFNLDTFINEKITTKHSFPHNFNLHQSTLDYYQKHEAGQTEIQELKQYNYQLIGIICHSGNAESGHYISYIKAADNKWMQFNDTQVSSFNPNNIEAECFGGFSMSTGLDDDFYDDKRENSKSAYILIYEKECSDTIKLVLNKQIESCQNQKQRQMIKNKLLNTLDLKQVISKITNQQNKDEKQKKQGLQQQQKVEKTTDMMQQSHEESSSAPEDSQKEVKKLLQEKQMEIKRLTSQDNIETELQVNKTGGMEDTIKQDEMVIDIRTPVSEYLPKNLEKQIMEDNQIHFLEKCVSSPAFVKFFASLISKPNTLYTKILNLCQKLTFGFWLKSPSFKDLLGMIDILLQKYPQGFESIVTNNPNVISLLIQSSDSQIRTSMASFLAKVIADAVSKRNINVNQNRNNPIFQFLDKLFYLLPSTVSKCWTKFSQYFQFWYELSTKGEVLAQYMIQREIVKHFMDYFLDTKSPLKIYATKREHQIGSSYANPNFSMLLKCVFSLLQQRLKLKQKNQDNKLLLSDPDEQKLLMSFESLQKLISESYQSIAGQLVKEICPNNLSASEKAAIVIIKGICKSNIDTIQPYLEVLHQFVLIQDQYQDLRIKWVIGKQTLAVSTISMKIIALNSYSLDQRLYNFDSSINVESSSSLLEQILTYSKKIQTLSMLCTKQLLKLCEVSKKIRDYVFHLQSPTLQTSKFSDFFKPFIDKYYEDYKKSHGFYSSSSFNRQQFAKEVKALYEKVTKIVEEDNPTQDKQKKIPKQERTEKQQVKKQQIAEEQRNEKAQIKEQQNSNQPQQPSKPLQNQFSSQLIPPQPPLPVEQSKPKQAQIQLKSFTTTSRTKNKIRYSTMATPADQTQIIDEDLYDEGDDWEGYDMNDGFDDSPKRYRAQNSSQVQDDSSRDKDKDDDRNYFKEEYEINYNKKFSQASVPEKISINDSEQQNQALIKPTKQPPSQPQIWHPIKFTYTPSPTPHPLSTPTIKISPHSSTLTLIITQPTGHSNKTFPSTGRTQKVSQRMISSALQYQKNITVDGYFIKNNGKDNIRIQTDDGCCYCRNGDGVFVWAKEIRRVWEAERTVDWPKWRLY